MKALSGSGGIAPRILDLGTRWRRVVIFTHRPSSPRERAPGTLWLEGWVCPRAGLDNQTHNREVVSVLMFYLRTYWKYVDEIWYRVSTPTFV